MGNKTVLYNKHIELGAKMVEFGGWNMPVQYTSIIEEHKTVRNSAGVFDVSHMGQIFVSGKQAVDFLQSIVPQDIAKLMIQKAEYCQLTRDNGGLTDDLIIYHLDKELYLIIANAANVQKDFEWLTSKAKGFEIILENKSNEFSMIALQGPNAGKIVKKLGLKEEEQPHFFTIKTFSLNGIEGYIARTGYTGEDGFEFIIKNEYALKLWDMIFKEGEEVIPCKYDDVRYQESTGDFIVSSGDKYGIIGTDKKTKVSINYDSIELMDYDAGLYLVARNNRYGVVDLNGNNVIYAENDQIGVDISRFEENDLKTGYILIDNLIPVMKNNKWGLFDTKGKQVVDFEYDSFGYIASSNREATNLLVIPGYNVIVACIDNRYTLLNALGEQPIRAFVDDIYMVISGGEKQYLMNANDKTYDVEEYLDRLGVLESTSNSNNTTNTSSDNTTTNSNENNNQVNNETTQENSEQSNGEEQSNEEQQSSGEEQNNEETQNSEEQQGNEQ